jgi:hypothetical protein
MATAKFIKTNITADQYDQMAAKLGVADAPPPGATFHLAAVGSDGKVKIVELWDSQEEADAWGEKVLAARDAAGFGAGEPPAVEYLAVQNLSQR